MRLSGVPAVLLAAALSAACTEGRPQARPTSSPSPSAPQVPTGTPTPCTAFGSGTELLVVGGQDAFNAELYRYRPCTGEVVPAGPGNRYSTVDAAGDHVVVSHGQRGADAVSLVRDQRLDPLGSVGTPTGLTPAVTPQGVVAWVAIDNDKDRPFALHVWDGTVSRVVHRSADALAPLSWGPDGLLALGRRKAGASGPVGNATVTVLRVGAAGDARVEWEHPLPFDLQRLEISHDGTRVAVSGAKRALVLDDRGRRSTALPAGWTVYAWNADDTQVLVAKDSQLGLARPGGGAPADLRTFPPGGVHGLAWPRD